MMIRDSALIKLICAVLKNKDTNSFIREIKSGVLVNSDGEPNAKAVIAEIEGEYFMVVESDNFDSFIEAFDDEDEAVTQLDKMIEEYNSPNNPRSA